MEIEQEDDFGLGTSASNRGRKHSEVWENKAEAIARTYLTVGRLLVEIDSNIDQFGQLLNFSQPAFPGKLGIRWWKKSNKSVMREPVLVLWKRNKQGRFYPVELDSASWSKRVKKRSFFLTNYPITHEIVRHVVELMRIRGLLKEVLVFKPVIYEVNLNRYLAVIEEQKSRLLHLSQSLEANFTVSTEGSDDNNAGQA